LKPTISRLHSSILFLFSECFLQTYRYIEWQSLNSGSDTKRFSRLQKKRDLYLLFTKNNRERETLNFSNALFLLW
jgi:hypothetical protein